MSNIKRVAFLLGSGISRYAGMPTTLDITTRVLSGQGVTYSSDGTYYLDDPNESIDPANNDYVWRIVLLLKRIQIEIESYYRYDRHHTTNYEELYYVCSQICDSIYGEYDNPIAGSFIDKLTPYANQLTKSSPNSIVEWDSERLISESLNYIRDVVWRLLLKEPEKLLKQSRGVIRNNWEEWSRQNRVPIIRKWIEGCTWNEIKADIAFIQND